MPRTIFVIVAMCVALWSAGACGQKAAARARVAEDVSGKFNQTGRAMPMTVALQDGGQKLGDVLIRVDKDDAISVSRNSLRDALKNDATPELLARVASLPTMIQLQQLAGAGLDIMFDRQNIALVMRRTAAQRRDSQISLGRRQPLVSGNLSKPAAVSGFVNVFAQSSYLWQLDETALRFDFVGAARVGKVVLESEVALENATNLNKCPVDAYCLFDHHAGFKRRGTRLVYDVVDWQDRIALGDVRSNATSFQRQPDILGLSIEHAPSKFDPTQPIRGTGNESFILQHAASVDVRINGVVMQRLRLPPGRHVLRDLPLQSGANEIALDITEDSGSTRTLKFDAYSSHTLLSVGKSEWALVAGLPSYYHDGEVKYVRDQYLASAFLRYGLTSGMTMEAHAQADRDVIMGGAGVVFGSPIGIWGIEVAASHASGELGTGGAARVTWEYKSKDQTSGIRLQAEIHTPEFRTPGQIRMLPTEILYPVYDSLMTFSGSYSRPLFDDWHASLSLGYDVVNDDFTITHPLVVRGDRYRANLTLSHPLGDGATVSGTIGYSNDSFSRNRYLPGASYRSDEDGEFWGGIRLSWRPAERTTVTVGGDTLNNRSFATGSYTTSPGLDSWAATVTAYDDRSHGYDAISASATYRGQRVEVSVAQDAGFDNQSKKQSGHIYGDHRTSLKLGTALFFAGDKVAISAPLRGDGGFAILTPHKSLGDRVVTAGTQDNERGRSDGWGPAVVTGMPAYVQQTIPVDVEDLPLGYSLGASGFDIRSPYKGGYAVTVGSGYSVSAIGTLKNQHGDPLSLVAGIVSNGSKELAVFTNNGGKFSASGLATGRWTFVMETDTGPVSYVVDVPEGTKGFLRLGELLPVKG